jgi:putative ABC transport system permease protein
VNAEVHARLSAFALAMVVVVGAASAAAVGAATAARQLDRARDFALFEALGATRAFASRLTLTENLLAAGAGGAAGVVLGLALGASVTQLAFGVALPPSPLALAAAVLLAVACAGGGTRVALHLLSRRSLSSVLGGS